LNSPISFLPSVFFLWRSSNHQAQASTWHGEHRRRTQLSLSSWDVRWIRRQCPNGHTWWGQKWWSSGSYPLVNSHITMERSTMFNG
jgi:hypothetical protein